MEEIKKILYVTPLFTKEGITKAARDYVKALKTDYSIMTSDYNFNPTFGLKEEDIYNPINVTQPDYVTIMNTRPEQWFAFSYNSMFGYHVLEGDVWPETQVKGINHSAVKCLMVPSTRCKDVATKSGVTKPIEVIPHIISDKFVCNDTSNPEKMTFLFSGAIFGIRKEDRKGLDLVLEAWKNFEDDDNKELILKVNTFYAENMYAAQGKKFNLNEYLATLYQKELPQNMKLLSINLSDDALTLMYNNVDCVLSPTRGEGFGLIPFEALACGVPCIVTEGLGCDEYLNVAKKGFLKIKQKGLCPAENRYPYLEGEKQSNWVEPDVEHFKEQMKEFANNEEKYRAEALEASKIIHENFNEKVIAEKFKKVFNSYA